MTSNDNILVTNDNNPIDLSQYLIQIPDFSQHLQKGLSFNEFLNTLITNVANNSDKCDVWSDVLLDIIDNNFISESSLIQVLNVTINKSKSDSVINRLFSCKMLAKLSLRLDENSIIQTIIPLVQCLCHDLHPSVRLHICKQLIVLSQNLCLETIKTQLLPQLIELTKDKEFFVRTASIESSIDLIPKLDFETNRQIVLPQIVLFFEMALLANDNSLVIVLMTFGKLCQTLPKDVITNEKWFLNYYTNIFLIINDFQISAKNIQINERDIECRKLLALYFPVLVQIYGPNELLNSILNFLCSDLDITVVQTVASVLNEISDCLKNAYKIYPQLSKLLSLRSLIVFKELMPFLDRLLIDIIKLAPNEDKNILFEDMTKLLLICENTLCLNLDWRLHIKFYECMTHVMPYLPPNLIKKDFIPLLLNRILTLRPIPLRISSSRCLISLYRDIPVLLEDLNIYEWFVTTLCNGKSCFQRMLFLNVCELIYEICDKNILIIYFLEPLLNLRNDKVPNIRINVCKKFRLFKPLLKIPEIYNRIERIKELFRQMMSEEKDLNVIESIKQLVDEFEWKSDFERIEIQELTQEFDCLTIDGPFVVNSCEVVSEINNNSIDDLKSDSIKHKSSLPQLIRSPLNTNSDVKCLPTNHINDCTKRLHSIPSKIPKPINKSSK